MTPIVRHNERSVRGRCIRNAEKEVKLCARGIPSWKNPMNLESPRMSSPGFRNDSKMMAIGVDVTSQVTPEKQC
ncbi:hypothetical protein TNCV_3258781 [Trichonephila clavipes]|nr:hypothetical protein TNCV_3258781 [Trichonephila clavipes]